MATYSAIMKVEVSDDDPTSVLLSCAFSDNVPKGADLFEGTTEDQRLALITLLSAAVECKGAIVSVLDSRSDESGEGGDGNLAEQVFGVLTAKKNIH